MLDIDPEAPEPPYEQLKRQLLEQIRSGELAHGSRLPTVRALAGALGLAANTVARSYRELETEGVLETRGRNGTVVAWSNDGAERELEQAAQAYVQRATELGIDTSRALEFVRAALR